jgi:ankyrin repeat protein
MNIHADEELLYQKLYERKLISYFMDDVEYPPEKEPNIEQLIRDGDFDIVRYFIEDDMFLSIQNDVISWASRYGNLDFVKYFVEKGYKILNNAISWASLNGHLEIIEYLIGKGGKIGIDSIKNASLGGHLEVIKYLIGKGGKITDDAIPYASKNGHLEVIKYFVEKGVKITIDSIKYAIYNDNLSIVQYFIENGFNVNYNNDEILIYCARWDRKDILDFLIENKANINVLDIETRKKYGYYLFEENNTDNEEYSCNTSDIEEDIDKIKTFRTINNYRYVKNILYIVEEENSSFFQIQLLNRYTKIKLMKWNEITEQEYNFTKIKNYDSKNNYEEEKYINYYYKKYLNDFFGKKIPTDKKNEVLIDYQNFIEYNKKINEICFKYTGKSNIDCDIKEKEDVYQNKYNKILVYNDNSHISFIIDNPDKDDLQLLENCVCGYKKYIEFENDEIDNNINISLITLFDKKCFDDEKSFIGEVEMFKKLYKIDNSLKRDVKTFILTNYTITDNINDKMKAIDLFNEIYKFLRIEEKINIRNKLTNFLLDIGLKKKRYNDGIYYYGLQKIK